MFEIKKYSPEYEDKLMKLIKQEGEDWKIYWEEPNASVYRKSFERSITYIALADGTVCGYSRSLEDALFIYVCDLLVNEKYRGNGVDKMLIESVCAAYPERQVYIMSGSDGYYDELGCKKEGSVYLYK